MLRNSDSVLCLQVFPQQLNTNGEFRAALLRYHSRGALHLVLLEESHLYTSHICSFHGCICGLTNLFSAMFGMSRQTHPLVLTVTGTINVPLLRLLSHLTGVDWSDKCHHV